MRQSSKLITFTLLAGTTIGAWAAFSIHLRHPTTPTLARAATPTSTARPVLTAGNAKEVIDFSWTRWSPLTADGQ